MKKRRILSALLVLFMFAGLLQTTGVTVWADDDTIIKNDESGIPDAGLYEAILNTADSNEDGVLTVAEAESIRRLYARKSGIKDITGIEYLKNVQGLFLDNNEISDIKPLESLINLRELWLTDNKLEDISPLANLTNLLALYLGSDLTDIQNGISEQCQISDITPLAGLVDLYYLYLGNSCISDISPLANLTELNTVGMYGNQVSDISPLAKSTGLNTLYLGNNQISDLSVLSNFEKLQTLDINDNNISNITPLLQMTNLKVLDVSYNKILDVDITKIENTLTGLRTFTKYGQNPDIPEFGWCQGSSATYWYENGIRQGTYDDPNGVLGDGTVRGREIYDPESDGWYWLDAIYDGAKAVNKEVWMPYIYQNEAEWDSEEIVANALASGDMAEQVIREINNRSGKWVRYDANGKMYKGWYTVEGDDAQIYPKQAGNTYYYDQQTGLMAKGEVNIEGQTYYFDEVTGVLQK